MAGESNHLILVSDPEWRSLQARVTALETTQHLLLEQIASMHAAVLYPTNLEARVTVSRLKYRELLWRLGLNPHKPKE